MKFWEIPAVIPELIFDGDKADRRLFTETLWWKITDEQQYKLVEKEIETHRIKKDQYLVWAWCDSSGFSYWAGRTNYIQVTVYFEQVEVDNSLLETLKKDVENVFDHFLKYAHEY